MKAANVLGLTFSEAFEKQPIELLQLLSLKAQDSFDEANLLVRAHSMPAASIAQILAESFLKVNLNLFYFSYDTCMILKLRDYYCWLHFNNFLNKEVFQ